MRYACLGAFILTGCIPAAGGPPPNVSPAASSQPAVPVAPAQVPTTESPQASSPVITEQARSHARAALGQALELWSSGRSPDANALVDVGLAAMARKLPGDGTRDYLGSLLESAAFSDDGSAVVIRDEETLSVAETTTGRFLGLRVHDAAQTTSNPAISPKGTSVVAPSGAELVVYESRGLAARLRIVARRDAPFAFISDDKLVTVRLGPAGPGVTLSPSIALQRTFPGSVEAGENGRALTVQAELEPDNQLSDDEIVVVDLKTGRLEQSLKLDVPPDQGMLRKVASLPPSKQCNEIDDCEMYERDPRPIGRRVEKLNIAAGMVVAGWQGGATTFHRLRDGKLIGAFRSRGERYKPGLVAIWPNPPRAAIATSLPRVGRGNEPGFSVTALFDVNHARIIELIDECRWATGLAFSDDGTKLMVGDLRRACLHDARTGRHLETTEELRPSRGINDEQQDVTVRPMPAGRWLLTTADGTYGVFDGRRLLFRGRTDGREKLMARDDRALFVADFSGGEAQLITFGPSGVERRILRTEELEQRKFPPEAAGSVEGRRAAVLEKMIQQSCLVEGFRLPLELCRMSQPLPGR